MNLLPHLRKVPNFPKVGIEFLDISPILNSASLFEECLSSMESLVDWSQVDAVLGIESRGFILGAPLAVRNKKAFIPCRKAGKLPPPVVQKSYDLEYGSATLELQPGQGRLLVVDDVLATGGTLEASLNLASQAGYQVSEVLVLINITQLNKFKFQNRTAKSLLELK